MSAGLISTVLILAVLVWLLVWAGASRYETLRQRFVAMYSQGSPIWIRNGLPLAPIWACGALLLAILVWLPRVAAVVLLIPALGLMELAFVLSYRVPAPLMPSWLRREIELGQTQVARPTRLDWLLFWMVVPVCAVGIVCIPVLLALDH
jgi:hypothetical protein